METYHLFISHFWNYSDTYEKLIKLLKNAAGFTFKDYSVPKDDPIHNAKNESLLKDAIRNQMQYASCVLILAGVYASYSKWINIEIELAQRGFSAPKKIIAIEPWGAENTSKVVKDCANSVVGWNTDSIISAIKAIR